MSFINGASLAPYCPGVSEDTLNIVATNTEALFCSLLPLTVGERKKSFRDDQVYYQNGWNKVNTSLLNITAISIFGDVIDDTEFKIDGLRNSSVRFKKIPIFDPVFDITFTSGYADGDIPFDLLDAMIKMGTDSALSIGTASNVKSYSLGPRSITFKDEGIASYVLTVLNSYLCF